jgi:predicted aspartyl protease
MSSAPSLSHAEQMYRIGNLDSAAQEYQALSSGADAAFAYVGLARVDLKQKHPADAYVAITKAIGLAPHAADVQVALGEVYYRQGKIPEAEVQFVNVINSGANNARAYLGLARVSNAASLYRRGKQMIDKAHSLDPSDPEIIRYWMETLPIADRIKAIQDYLAQGTIDDAEGHGAMQRQLILLQQTQAAPVHTCRMTSKVTATETNLKQLLIDSNHLRGYGLDVRINGAATAHLMLDTGAGGILVDRKIAEKASIPQIVHTDLRGIGDRGPAGGYVGAADSIQIGDLEFRDCRVEVMDSSSVVGEDGLIGGDVFAHFLVDIDSPHGKFRLSELPPRPEEPAEQAALDAGGNPDSNFHDRYIAPEMKTYSRVFRFGHMLLIPTRLNDSVQTLFLIDTGSLMNAISPDAAREVTKVSSDSDTHVKGINGSVKNVFRGNELTLTFGTFRQKNLDIIAFDTKSMSDSAGTEISGILGFTLLHMLDMKIDYRDGLVSFEFDPNRWRF